MKIIDDVTDSCETCVALKQLPKEIFSESTGEIDGFGSHFSADVIERNQQCIIIVREKLSSFTMTKFIKDQTANSLKEALITMILEMIPHSGTTVQVDCASAWQTLANESNQDRSQLKRLNIKIDLGRHHNRNKNPISDNACKEFHKETLRLKPEGTKLNDIERAMITANMNQRIRKSGLSSKEICYKRDLISNMERTITDQDIAKKIIQERKERHNLYQENQVDIQVGHNVFLKNDKSKMRARELYKVIQTYVENGEPWAIIQKHNSQFRMKKYKVKTAELILLPGQNYTPKTEENEGHEEPRTKTKKPTQTNIERERNKPKIKRQAAIRARELIAQMDAVQLPKKNDNLKHGWDYERHLEMLAYDDEDIFYVPIDEHPPQQATSDDERITFSGSPTTSSSSSSEYDSETSDKEDIPPPIPPKLPMNLLERQDLSSQLDLPEVIDAAKTHHYTLDPLRRRTSSRKRNNLLDYAKFSKTGEK